MPATFNHTIIAARDRNESARFYLELLGAQAGAPSWGVFTNIQLHDGVLLQFAEPGVEIQMNHYAFLVDDDLFDRAESSGCATAGSRDWADPQMRHPRRDQHRTRRPGCLLKGPAGHGIELITRPYL